MLPYATSEHNEPLQITPWTNYGLIAANVLAFLYELTIGGTRRWAAQHVHS